MKQKMGQYPQLDPLNPTWQIHFMPDAWSKEEVEATISDYFSMLVMELQGIKYVKSKHNQKLQQKLNNRTGGSVEFKHCNISAILLQLGLPYIDGYKRRDNYQNLLRKQVEEYIAEHPEFGDNLIKASEDENIPDTSVANPLSLLVEPPEIITPDGSEPSSPRKRTGRKNIDFAGREAKNRKLGELGEEFVLEFEHRRLETSGHQDLAKRIEHVSKTQGDGLGFDILSFDESGSERFIEVKTTNSGRSYPFLISRNEVAFSHENPERYALYRVFKFRTDKKLFILDGDVGQHCQMEPTVYRAGFGAAS